MSNGDIPLSRFIITNARPMIVEKTSVKKEITPYPNVNRNI